MVPPSSEVLEDRVKSQGEGNGFYKMLTSIYNIISEQDCAG